MSSASFTSRLGLIKNLEKHLLNGRSAVMAGGPMIGKTTLAHKLIERINSGIPASEGYRAIYLSLEHMKSEGDFWSSLLDAILCQGIESDYKNPYRKPPRTFVTLMTQLHHIYEKIPTAVGSRKLILLIDDCARLLPDAEILTSQIENMVMELLIPSIEAVCWVGGLDWMDWTEGHADVFHRPLRFYPLSVVPIREARSIIRERLGPEKVDALWHETGGHPFLLEKVLGNKNETSMDILNRRIRVALKPEEKAILNRLDPNGEWKVLEALKDEKGQRPPKALLDRLCMLGVMVRTLNNGTAVVRRTSVLLTKI